MFNTNNSAPYTGIDLMSLDFTRGRDVGLQPYNRYRQLCGLPLAKDFDDLTDLLHIKVMHIVKYRKQYYWRNILPSNILLFIFYFFSTIQMN